MKKSNLSKIVKEEIQKIFEASLPAHKIQVDGLIYIFDRNFKFLGAQDKKGAPYKALGSNVDYAKERLQKKVGAGKGTWREGLVESLTKKDFVNMVKHIKNAPPQHRQALADFAVKISKEDNPRFDEKRFRDAISVLEGRKNVTEGVLNEDCAQLISPLQNTLKHIEQWEPLIAKAVKEALAMPPYGAGIATKLQDKHNEAYHAVEDLLKWIKVLAKKQGEIK
jgi:predicted metal-dependent hydrolase